MPTDADAKTERDNTIVEAGEQAKKVIANTDMPETKSTKKQLTFEGYDFTVDTDLLDDVEAFELIDRIENKGQTAAIVPLLKFLIGADGYEDMKSYFTKRDGRFRVTTLVKIYPVIIENFDPKD